jgi:uncharacterized membrane protein
VTAPSKHPGWSDQQVEQTIGNLLRFGLMIATAVVLAGAAVYLARHGSEQPDYRLFHGEPADLRGVSGIVHEALQRSGRGLIQLGLLFLLATPVVRVAFSILAFALQRDRLYVGVTLVVLGVLLYSIVGGYLP